MSGLRLVPPPPTDPENWKRLLNHLYGCGEDELFRWAKSVRAAVEEAEREKEAA